MNPYQTIWSFIVAWMTDVIVSLVNSLIAIIKAWVLFVETPMGEKQKQQREGIVTQKQI